MYLKGGLSRFLSYFLFWYQDYKKDALACLIVLAAITGLFVLVSAALVLVGYIFNLIRLYMGYGWAVVILGGGIFLLILIFQIQDSMNITGQKIKSHIRYKLENKDE